MLEQFLSVLCVFALVHLGSSETGCPDDEDILPCKCTNAPLTYLECKNVNDAEDLRRVFQNSEAYTYKEVHIEASSLQYLPYDLFEKVKVRELYLVNVTLNQLFDRQPEALDSLWKFHMEHTFLLRGVMWGLLEPMKSLAYLSVYYNDIKSLGKDFNKYTPKDLEQLVFYATKTKKLEKGVFKNFTKLDRVEISAAKLQELSRDSFDETFNGRYLYFNQNNITKISPDMFHKMPNIKSIMLRDNQLTKLEESSFDGNFLNLNSIYLEGNPLKCDCHMQWIARYSRYIRDITGKCVAPKKMNGKELKNLQLNDFNC